MAWRPRAAFWLTLILLFTISFGVRAYPALAQGRLYARSKDALVCLDLANPK